jgi:thiol-disulfide isomerase/thioredoxin
MNLKLGGSLMLAALLIAGVVFYLGQSSQPAGMPQAAENVAAPLLVTEAASEAVERRIEFSLPDLDGTVRNIADWNGKARLINFWATWCAPCRREIPLLKSTQAKHAADNIQIIGIAVDEVEPTRNYAAEAEFNYPILVGQEEAMQAAAASGVDFIGMPFTLIVAPGGELLATHIGEIVESHIELILEVFAQLEAGDIDLAAARNALRDL